MQTKNFILGCYYGYHANNKFKTFLDIGRSSGLDYFSARGLQNKYSCDPNKFFRRMFLNTDSDLYSVFADNLMADLRGMHHMTREAIERNSNGYLTSDNATQTTNGNIPQTSVNMSDNSAQVETVKTVVNNLPSVKVTEVKQEAKNINAGLMFNLNVGEIVTGAVEDYINNSGILKNLNDRIMDEARKLRPNEIKIGERPTVEIKGKLHSSFQDTLNDLVSYKQVYLCGPAGTGKTTLAGQCAEALNIPFGFLSCSAGVSEGHLIGKMNHAGEYLSADFVEMYENGGLFLLDEVDRGDESVLIVLNSALANGKMSVPSRVGNTIAKRHKDFYCICAGNTWGKGSNEFSTAVVLDKSLVDRFIGAKIYVDYDMELENDISNMFPVVASTVQAMRRNAKQNNVKHDLTTRAIINGVIALKRGDSLKKYVSKITIDWTDQEKSKVLTNINLN